MFTYDTNKGPSDYKNMTFEPIFLDEMNASAVSQAQEYCGSDYACVFDLIATEDTSFADLTKLANEEATAIQLSQGKLSVW